MNIPKNRDKGAKTESVIEPPAARYSQPYLVAESVMEDFVKHLTVRESETAISRLQAAADILERLRDKPESEPDEVDLQLISWLASESKNKNYRQIMKAIVSAVGEGSEGIKAAHRTATRAVELGFRWSIYYFGALEMYKARLKSINRAAESGR